MRARYLIVSSLIISLALPSLTLGWTAPTSTPPGGNVSSPINTGATSQLKNGTLGVNGLGVFGNTILNGTNGDGTGNGVNSYLNFGATVGQAGYGIRDNNGTLEYKNSSGSWGSLNMTLTSLLQVNGITTNGLGQITSIKFGDSTTLTTAASSNPWSTNGTSIYYNGGNVGVGTNNPTAKLTIGGTAGVDGIKFPDGTLQTTAGGSTAEGGPGCPTIGTVTEPGTGSVGPACTDGSKFLGRYAGANYFATASDDPDANQANAIAYCKSLNRHGHTDWFLPNIDVLRMMFENRTQIGGFSLTINYSGDSLYWASDGYGISSVTWPNGNNIDFLGTGYNAGDYNGNTGGIIHVRCVRRA